MQLTVIIVNFNVKHFLEHCLTSVIAASKTVALKIIVVDNASKDESVAYISKKYPHIQIIANKENVGFAKANNQALALVDTPYMCYLNPDTIVAEDCFELCLTYLQNNKVIGALGPHLIDGKGNFLPESKRGFPDFLTSFFKISGVSSIFKKSSFFNRYHLGHLPENKTNIVDVLVGCFIMMPTALAKQIGGFDEAYFMYGEDIDLSYKVQKAGYKNVYFAETSVIHYKGESTKKGSLNYVKLFYNAMIIFATKHLSVAKQKTFIPLIKLAIIARAFLSLLNKFIFSLWLPLLDAITIWCSLSITKSYWVKYIKTSTAYENNIVNSFFITYIFIWLISIFLNGGYDIPLKKIRIIRGMGIGVLITLALYGILPEHVRFSRGITVIGATVSTTIIWLLRWLMQYLKIKAVEPAYNNGANIIAVANTHQMQQVNNLLQQAGIEKDIIGSISNEENSIGTITHLKEIANVYKASEIIFTYPSISFKNIIEAIKNNGNVLNYKIYAEHTESIIGSNSKNTAGDIYATDAHFSIATPFGRRNKKIFDLSSSLLLLFLSPLLIFIIKNKSVFKSALLVLFSNKTWVGYSSKGIDKQLPKIKNSIFEIGNSLTLSENNAKILNMFYAKNYKVNEDIKNLLKNI